MIEIKTTKIEDEFLEKIKKGIEKKLSDLNVKTIEINIDRDITNPNENGPCILDGKLYFKNKIINLSNIKFCWSEDVKMLIEEISRVIVIDVLHITPDDKRAKFVNHLFIN